MTSNNDKLAETLGKEIRLGREDMKKQFENINRKFEDMKDETKKNEEQMKNRIKKIEDQIEALKTTDNTEDEVTKRKRTSNSTVSVSPLAGNNAWDKPLAHDASLARQLREARMENDRILKDRKNQERAAAAADAWRLEEEKRNFEKSKKPIIKSGKLEDSGPLHNQDDWSWNESDDEWTNSVDRIEKNREKKRAARNRKLETQRRVTTKNKCIIGLGPIKQSTISHKNEIVGDYLEAKKMAVLDFLRDKLQYNDEEIDSINITDTQVSAKTENLVYIVVSEEASIRDIRTRMAECRNPDLSMMDFIPPQYFQRYIALSKRARDMREQNDSLRTQIRFGDSDIELFTKNRGENERYSKVPMEEVEADEPLPKFDHTIKWKRRDDRPRRHISPVKSADSRRMEDDEVTKNSTKHRKLNSEKIQTVTEPMEDMDDL